MSRLPLSFCTGPYDRMAAIFDGSISIDGVDLIPMAVQQPMEIFARMLQNQEFDISEMSLTHCYALRQNGKARFFTVPVFPSRMFRHSYIFINRHKIRTPQDLAGKRIGVQGFQMTAAVWIRGLLRHQYDVSLQDVEWVEGGVNEKGVAGGEATSFHPKGLKVSHAGNSRSLSDMLATGEIDALIGAIKPASLRASPDVARLFPNYHEIERSYFKETGIFPIMHAMVIKDGVHLANPWLANNLYKACEQAKAIALNKSRFTGALQFMLPWLDEHLEELHDLFGGDAWLYGVARNRKALVAFSDYLVEDGLLAKPMAPEEVFLPIDGLAAKG